MNKNLFKTAKPAPVPYIPKDVKIVKNKAGKEAFELSVEQQLCQYAVTCCFNGTFYASAEDHLKTISALLPKVRPELIAKVAVYAHEQGNMKDMPAYLLSYLFANGYTDLVEGIFSRVVTNTKMLCNFVQFVRSGTHGRKSFGTVGKRLIKAWLQARTAEQLFRDSVGHSNPSLNDIIKMVHPKFTLEGTNNVVKYLLDKEYITADLPDLVARFEFIKKGVDASPEGLDFRLLSNLTLSANRWGDLAKGMGWNALRMNLNNLQKHGVFGNAKLTTELADKLRDKAAIKKFNAFPYQLMTSYQNTTNVPNEIKAALEDALEVATENVPNLGRVAVCVDVSGSMNSPATGYRVGSTSVTTCVDVAGLIGSALTRTADVATIVPFDTAVRTVYLSKRDSVLTNAKKLAMHGGGTDCWCALKHLIDTKWTGDVVFMVSDNESWRCYDSPNQAVRFKQAWDTIKARNPGCKLILLDITPNSTSQMHEDKNVLHVGGFSDQVFEVMKTFVSGDGNFVNVIEKVKL